MQTNETLKSLRLRLDPGHSVTQYRMKPDSEPHVVNPFRWECTEDHTGKGGHYSEKQTSKFSQKSLHDSNVPSLWLYFHEDVWWQQRGIKLNYFNSHSVFCSMVSTIIFNNNYLDYLIYKNTFYNWLVVHSSSTNTKYMSNASEIVIFHGSSSN